MNIVIVGFGRVGMRTARVLQSEGHDVTIVEVDPARVERAREEGFTAIEGDGGDESVLDAVDLEAVDGVAGLTGDVTTNFSVCVAGRAHGCRTVLRVDEDFGEELYETYTEDVDEIVYPERLGAAGAKTALLGGDFNVLADLTETLSIATVQVPDGSPIVGQRVADLDLAADARITTHSRTGEEMSIPLPTTTIRPGDSIGIMAPPDVLQQVRGRLRGEPADA